ncbi:uncharacterized protein DS421_8g225330 [Arachis hypogaea]|nr:uncharacterized protein DS421_8g225330 [Arachis hypogaea]
MHGEAIRFAVTAYTLDNADREAKSNDSCMVNVGDNSGGIANRCQYFDVQIFRNLYGILGIRLVFFL